MRQPFSFFISGLDIAQNFLRSHQLTFLLQIVMQRIFFIAAFEASSQSVREFQLFFHNLSMPLRTIQHPY
ncbi:hypothetical protein [Citrobacter pasteurii]|nr:hypothetical protein [Citrobacter pasteurii]